MSPLNCLRLLTSDSYFPPQHLNFSKYYFRQEIYEKDNKQNLFALKSKSQITCKAVNQRGEGIVMGGY